MIYNRTFGVDIYAFAIIAYEIMIGLKPYNEFTNAADIINKVTKNNGRLNFKKLIPDCYKNLIETCWDSDIEKRPSFEEIVEMLKTDPSFITDEVDKDEYLNYIEFIETKGMSTYDYQTHKLVFFKNKTRVDSFQKINIYQNRNIETKMKRLSVDILPIDLTKYETIKFINEGSFGIVYEISDKITNIKYAAKVSKRKLTLIKVSDKIDLEREITIISKLNHPSV